MTGLTASLQDARELVDQFFAGSSALFGPLQRPDRGAEIVAGTVFRFRAQHRSEGPVLLTMYLGLRELGGALWDREIRALLSLAQRAHAHLPRILDGRYVGLDSDRPFAYVLASAGKYDLSHAQALDYVTWNRDLEGRSRSYRLRQFLGLADGLLRLHRRGHIHRNLSPAAVEYVESDDRDRPYALRLARFEMSSLIGNLVRRGDEGVPAEVARGIWAAAADPFSQLCQPPERWRFLAGETDELDETDRVDVYALGALGWALLVRVTEEEAEESGDDGLRQLARKDASMLGDLSDGTVALPAMRAYMQDRCRNPMVPDELGRRLHEMLHPHARSRPSLGEVVAHLQGDYEALAHRFDGRPDDRRLLLGYFPVESRKTLYLKWGEIQIDPALDDGPLRELMEADLRGAEAVYSPGGFVAWGRSGDPLDRKKEERARYVALGKRFAWFCEPYKERFARFARGGEGGEVWELLLVKFVIQRERVWTLEDSPLRRRLPPIKLYSIPNIRDIDLGDVQAAAAEGAAPDDAEPVVTWQAFLLSLEHESPTPPWMVIRQRAMQFLLDVQRAALRARQFPFRRRSDPVGERHTLQHDPDIERQSIEKNPEFSLYCQVFPREMGPLFRGLDGEDQSAVLEILADSEGRMDTRREALGKVRVLPGEEGRVDIVNVQALHGRGAWIPEQGWLRPVDDRPSDKLLSRQQAAASELHRMDLLQNQLHAPFTVRGLPFRWEGVAADLDESGQAAALEMLVCRPFYALHGPPGAGKTAVAARAIAAYLAGEPGARVLVTSQNHHGLDNLAISVLKEVHKAGIRPVVVRVVSDKALADEKPMPEMVEHALREQAPRLARAASALASRLLEQGELRDGRPIDAAIATVLAAWKDGATRCELELRDRLRRASTLVFATTGTCHPGLVGGATPEEAFDWVIVEEAARAWPSELAMPLVRGNRWTLIGDHVQLQAFDRQKLSRLLSEAADSDVDALQVHADSTSEYERFYSLFESLFVEPRNPKGEAHKTLPSAMRAVLGAPLGRLDTQHRMREPIAEVVGRAFYRVADVPEEQRTPRMSKLLAGNPDSTWLRSGARVERPHGLRAPGILLGHPSTGLTESSAGEPSLLWLDTTGLPDSECVPYWSNLAESRIVARLCERLSPAPRAGKDDFLDEPVAILTPYLAQVLRLKQDLPSAYSGHVHTVDSFQGRQADIVFVSLVRAMSRGQTPEASIGYLVEPSRVNVMFSRARRLLVIVGSFAHFEGVVQKFATPARKDLRGWACIVRDIRAGGHLVTADRVLRFSERG